MNKLNVKVLAAVVMMLGALGAVGCNKSNDQGTAQDNAAPQPVAQSNAAPEQAAAASDDSTTTPASTSAGFEQDAMRFGVYVPFGPPAPRFERHDRAPSARHFWVNGYHKFVDGRYVWVGGHWDVRRNGYTFVQPHYDRINGRVRYMPGHFARR